MGMALDPAKIETERDLRPLPCYHCLVTPRAPLAGFDVVGVGGRFGAAARTATAGQGASMSETVSPAAASQPEPLAWLDEPLAIVFPGQGSQSVGMGRALREVSPAAQRVFARADAALGFPLSELAFEGPADELEDTLNAQPAILTTSHAALAAIEERLAVQGRRLEPVVVAGHSLGEFTALVAAGSLDFEAALKLVRERGRLMKEAGDERPGGMAAVLGLDDETLAAVVAEAASEGIVVVANANCPGQTVISGEVDALNRAAELARERGAKRVARLAISIASHSPLMERAAAQLAALIDEVPLRPPRLPVVANTTGRAMTTVAQIREELVHHVERPVKWTDSVREMVAAGATTVVEVGPGKTLAGLVKRIDGGVRTLGPADLGLDLPA
jgi:[acyl-carrier-protein] S-malonyltransferase